MMRLTQADIRKRARSMWATESQPAPCGLSLGPEEQVGAAGGEGCGKRVRGGPTSKDRNGRTDEGSGARGHRLRERQVPRDAVWWGAVGLERQAPPVTGPRVPRGTIAGFEWRKIRIRAVLKKMPLRLGTRGLGHQERATW